MNARLAPATTTTAHAVVRAVSGVVHTHSGTYHVTRFASVSPKPRFSKRTARWHRTAPM